MRMCHFQVQNGPFVTNKFFLVQTIIITLIYLLALFIVQNLKKFLQQIQSYEDAPFLDPNWPISSNGDFFRKPVNEPCFFHSCLSTCQKSKSDINLLKKYWRLKNTEISLVESFLVITSVLDFSQAWSFHRMLMNHSNFHFTQIPAETNVVFFKKSKNHVLGQFLTIFSQFCPRGILSKKSDCHTQLYMGP